jgi:hypothetical protein
MITNRKGRLGGVPHVSPVLRDMGTGKLPTRYI